jgi:hypothetical protein
MEARVEQREAEVVILQKVLQAVLECGSLGQVFLQYENRCRPAVPGEKAK